MDLKSSWEKMPVVWPSLQRIAMAYRPTGFNSKGLTVGSVSRRTPSLQAAQGQEVLKKGQVYKLSWPSLQRILKAVSPTRSIRSGSSWVPML